MAKILVIDDQPEILLAIRKILEAEGHQVLQASDGNEALTSFKADPPDLVITDLFMPGKDGIEFLLELKTVSPASRVIAMSGGGVLPREEILEFADVLGAHTLLRKPFSREEVLDAIGKVLDQELESRPGR